jgi:hypothetical protein
MRYELSDYEWTAIKPMLPTSRAAVGVEMTVACSMASFGSYIQVRPRLTLASTSYVLPVKTWMAGTSPAMTVEIETHPLTAPACIFRPSRLG